jgi:hypothetical protein
VLSRRKDCNGMATSKGCQSREEKKRTSKKNLNGRSTSSHDNKKFRTSSVEKQGGIAFGLWKTATAVIKLAR